MIEDYHFALWAKSEAENYPAPRLAMSRIPMERQPRKGMNLPSARDWERAQLVANAVNALVRAEPEAGRQLRVWYGAYPDTPTKRSERVRLMGFKDARTARNKVYEHEAWVRGWIYCYKSSN